VDGRVQRGAGVVVQPDDGDVLHAPAARDRAHRGDQDRGRGARVVLSDLDQARVRGGGGSHGPSHASERSRPAAAPAIGAGPWTERNSRVAPRLRAPGPRPTIGTMNDPSSALSGTFVEPRGMVRSIVAATAGRQLGGAVGGLIAGQATDPGAQSPLKKGEIAYLGVFDTEVVLFRAKRGAFKPKPLADRVATAARTELVGAQLARHGLSGALELRFADGATWAFDVPKVHLKGAQAIADALS
jgi:hypothetical protein